MPSFSTDAVAIASFRCRQSLPVALLLCPSCPCNLVSRQLGIHIHSTLRHWSRQVICRCRSREGRLRVTLVVEVEDAGCLWHQPLQLLLAFLWQEVEGSLHWSWGVAVANHFKS